MSERKSLSLFSGAGGMDIGIKRAGFSVLAEIEIDKYCCETLRAAVERDGVNTHVIEADIRTVEPNDIIDMFNLQSGELDLLFGGPPCQPFSLAGKQQGLDDTRGPLLFEIIRFAEQLKPKVILLEQVKGLLSAKNQKGEKGGVFNHFLSELARIGYIPKWQVCLAADYGVPQLRERVFVVATRAHNGFVFPEHTHVPYNDNLNLFSLPPYVTVGEALNGLGTPMPKVQGTTFQNCEDSHVDVTPPRDRERISYVPEGSYLAAQTHVSVDIRGGLTQKDTTKYLRLDRNRPSNTLRCGEIFYHPTENRYLTPREYMRIHGFGDDYKLFGPVRSRTGSVKDLDQHRQVANSVPPPMAYVMGNKIRGYLNEQNI